MTPLRIASRASPLAKAQVHEIIGALKEYHPHLTIETTWVQTTGDLDQKTSLRQLAKTDFFTREIDALVLDGACDIGVHSAKDLPAPLPKGLEVIALTRGLDPSDALVLRPGETVLSLRPAAVIATSSVRREEMVRQLRPDLTFTDVRGTIEQRLSRLDSGEVDGVVVATAAIMRLDLLHLNHFILPGHTVEGQGRLAIVARSDNHALTTLFQSLDDR